MKALSAKLVFWAALGALPLPLMAAQEPAPAVEDKPSTLIGAALDTVAHAGSSVDLNKWKGGNGLRQDVDGNLASVQKDLQTTLPPLMAAADAAPQSAAASMPVLLNLDALYSVLLRISLGGKGNAPHEQSVAIDGALASLDGARRDMGERILRITAAQEQQVAKLQAQLQQAQQPAPVAAPVAVPVPVKPAVKKRRAVPKPAAAPTTPASPAAPAAK